MLSVLCAIFVCRNICVYIYIGICILCFLRSVGMSGIFLYTYVSFGNFFWSGKDFFLQFTCVFAFPVSFSYSFFGVCVFSADGGNYNDELQVKF